MGTLIKSIKLTPAIPPVVTLKSEDGKYHLGIKSLCGSLGVSKTGQMQRIRSTPELASALHYESIETPGGQQKLAVMEVWESRSGLPRCISADYYRQRKRRHYS